jgi:mRNA interferase HigB
MQIVARRALKAFWESHPTAQAALVLWYKRVRQAEWTGPADVKEMFGTTVDFVSDNRLIFDIGGNKFRLIVHVAHPFKRVLIKFVGTHREYDKIDQEAV